MAKIKTKEEILSEISVIVSQGLRSGYSIDLDVLEDVALAKGGVALTPKELLDMWKDGGMFVFRSKGSSRRPIEEYCNFSGIKLLYLCKELLELPNDEQNDERSVATESK